MARKKLLKFIRVTPEPVLLLLPGTRRILIIGHLALGNIRGSGVLQLDLLQCLDHLELLIDRLLLVTDGEKRCFHAP